MMLNAAQAAEILGISARLVYAQAAPAGPIPCYRIGARISFDESEIQEYKKSCQCTEIKKQDAIALRSTVTLTARGSEPESYFLKLGLKPRLTPTTAKNRRDSTPSRQESRAKILQLTMRYIECDPRILRQMFADVIYGASPGR